MKIIILLIFIISLLESYNTPCSGRMGGVKGCTNDGKFLCKNGKISSSKRKCTNYQIENEQTNDEYYNQINNNITDDDEYKTSNNYKSTKTTIYLKGSKEYKKLEKEIIKEKQNYNKNILYISKSKLHNVTYIGNFKGKKDDILIRSSDGSFHFKIEKFKDAKYINFDKDLIKKANNLINENTNFDKNNINYNNNFIKKIDKIINKNIYKVYYSYKYKGALFVKYSLDGNLVNQNNIKKRMRFYNEKTIPAKYRSKPSDYKNSGYDKGHLASDASFDYDIKSLRKAYSMVNIIPQAPKVNRFTWIKTEKLERKIARKLGKVDVEIGIIYNNNGKKIGNNIYVPEAFYKKISNKSKKYEKCFFYKNELIIDTKSDKLKNHLVDCKSLDFI